MKFLHNNSNNTSNEIIFNSINNVKENFQIGSNLYDPVSWAILQNSSELNVDEYFKNHTPVPTIIEENKGNNNGNNNRNNQNSIDSEFTEKWSQWIQNSNLDQKTIQYLNEYDNINYKTYFLEQVYRWDGMYMVNRDGSAEYIELWKLYPSTNTEDIKKNVIKVLVLSLKHEFNVIGIGKLITHNLPLPARVLERTSYTHEANIKRILDQEEGGKVFGNDAIIMYWTDFANPPWAPSYILLDDENDIHVYSTPDLGGIGEHRARPSIQSTTGRKKIQNIDEINQKKTTDWKTYLHENEQNYEENIQNTIRTFPNNKILWLITIDRRISGSWIADVPRGQGEKYKFTLNINGTNLSKLEGNGTQHGKSPGRDWDFDIIEGSLTDTTVRLVLKFEGNDIEEWIGELNGEMQMSLSYIRHGQQSEEFIMNKTDPTAGNIINKVSPYEIVSKSSNILIRMLLINGKHENKDNILTYEFICSDSEYNDIFSIYNHNGVRQIIFNDRIEPPYDYFYNKVNDDRCICPLDGYTFIKTERNTGNLQDNYSGLCNPK